MEDLKPILEKFAASGWDLIAVPAAQWLNGEHNRGALLSAVQQADQICGNCGCELDLLYKKALELLSAPSAPINQERSNGIPF